MICKSCKKSIDNDSVYCKYCGVKVRKEKAEISVPAPRRLPSGNFTIQLRAEGISITEDTAEKCILKAKAIRAGYMEQEKKEKPVSLRYACEKYISERDNILSPSTIAGYKAIVRTRFQSCMDKDLRKINFQKMINDEKCSPKTLKNAWGFVLSCLKQYDIAPAVSLPQVVPHELAWLDYEQILIFIDAIKNKPYEAGALLALHGLRQSELLAVTADKIADGTITVSGAVVRNADGKMQEKDTNKNLSSRREVPVFISRLLELVGDGKVVKVSASCLYKGINSSCRSAGLPEVGVHGLRRSFASLCYHVGISERECMKLGGWSDYQIMHKIYIKLSDADGEDARIKLQEKFR